jgi:hypothetical protein
MVTFLATTSSVTGIVAIVAFEAGSRGKVDGVAITANCSLMVDTVYFTTASGMG